MSALSALWARAPLWRGAVVAAAASTALAAVYADWPPAARRPAAPVAAGSYSPQPPPPPRPPSGAAGGLPRLSSVGAPPAPAAPPAAKGAGAAAPAFGEGFTGTVPLLGLSLPLPEGRWTVVAANSGAAPDGEAAGGAVLARIEGGRVAGLVVASGSVAPAASRRGFHGTDLCQTDDTLHARIFSNIDHGPQDVWCISRMAAAGWENPDLPPMVRAAVGDIRQRGATIPQIGLVAAYGAADQDRKLAVLYLFSAAAAGLAEVPAAAVGAEWSAIGIQRTPERRAFLGQVRGWAARWHPLIRRAFAGDLAPDDVAPALARLP